MMPPIICSKCNILPTRHQCVKCRTVYVCPECADRRGYDNLNNIVCKECNKDHHSSDDATNTDRSEGSEVVQKNNTGEAGAIVESVQESEKECVISKETVPVYVDAPLPLIEAPTVARNEFCSVTVKPKRLHKKMGKFAEVSVPLKSIIPLNPIKTKYANTYKQTRTTFIVQDLKCFETGKKENIV